MYFILRFFLDAIAYILAVCGAMAFMAALFLATPGAAHMDPLDKVFGLLMLIHLTGLRFAHDAFVPAVLVIAYGEWRAARDWLYYALGGAGVALVALIAHHWTPQGAAEPAAGWIMLAAAGAVAGTVYWLVAGWSAGVKRRTPSRATSSGPSGS